METETSFPYSDTILHKKRKRYFVSPDLDSPDAYIDDDIDDVGADEQIEILEDGTVIKKIQNRNSHKVVITEEKMSDALNGLQVLKMDDEKQQNPGFILTDQLKSSMDLIKRSEQEYSEKFLRPEKQMQIIPWISNDIHIHVRSRLDDSSNDSSDLLECSTDYKVEEPCEVKNPLKRTHSEANPLIVEELNIASEQNAVKKSSNYLVELATDACDEIPDTNPSSIESKCNFNFNITELPDLTSIKHRKGNNEELMDI